MRIVQLLASPFYGGPERQVLGVARHLPAECETVFLTFAEGGRCQAMLDEVRGHGFRGEALRHNFPRLGRCVREIAERLRELEADLICCSGYKPDLLGWRAARQVGIPAVIVSHGWTGATWKVRVYEAMDRWVHGQVDAVVSVSEAQARKVKAAGVRPGRMTTIENAVGEEAFAPPEPEYRDRLRGLFTWQPRWVIGAAGRLSPEKGFDQLVEAAAFLAKRHPEAGVVIFGDGPMRGMLEQRSETLGLKGRVVLAGFTRDLGKFLPHLDAAAVPSFTEGLPVILLEYLAAGVPVVATAVGGIPEVIEEGVTGRLVPSGQPAALAEKLARLLDDVAERRRLGETGCDLVRTRFGAARQAERYFKLFQRLVTRAELVENRR